MERSALSLPFSFPHVGVTRGAPPLPEEVAGEGWTLDHNRVVVGHGEAAYRRARRLLDRWAQFDLGWASVNAPPVRPGQPVVVTAFSLLCWSCNPLRVAYAEEGPLRRRARGGAAPPWAGAPPAAVAGASLRQQRWQAGAGSLWGLLDARRDGAGGQRRQHAAAAAEARPPRGRRCAYAHATLAGHQISGEERFSVAWNAEDDSVWYEIYTLSRPGSLVAAAAHPVLRALQRRFAADSCDAMQRRVAAGT